MDVDLPSSRGARRSRSMSIQPSPPIILPMSTIRIGIINLFEMLNSYHSYSSEMDRGDPFTTPPTMLNIPEKHSIVLKLADKVIPNTKHSPTEEARRKHTERNEEARGMHGGGAEETQEEAQRRRE